MNVPAHSGLTSERQKRLDASRRRRGDFPGKKTWDFSRPDHQGNGEAGSGNDAGFSGKRFQHGDSIGLYRIEGVLGSGGMGRVFKVQHTVTGSVQALKVVLREEPNGAERAKRFFQEVRIQAGMNHAGVPAVHNAFSEGDILAMAMELIEGQSLERLLKERPVPLSEGIGYVLQVLDVLGHIHGKNVAHRDVSPGNIMVGWDGNVRLTDFGLAKVTTDGRPSEAGVVVGAVYYMSPEQVRGDASLDQRTDIYSLGVVLYELLTGRKPFEGDNHYSVMRAHVEQEAVAPMEINPRIPPSLSGAICTAMAKEPGRRFQSAGQFREALEGTEVREGAWNPGSMWEGISGALQKLKPAPTQLASNDYRELIPAEPSSGSGPAPLPPALRELASSLSCLSGSGPSDSR